VLVQETTVATIDGWKITVGNIMEDDWVGVDGVSRHGLTAEIGVYDRNKTEQAHGTLGEGGVLQING